MRSALFVAALLLGSSCGGSRDSAPDAGSPPPDGRTEGDAALPPADARSPSADASHDAEPFVLRCDGRDDEVLVELGDVLSEPAPLTVELWFRVAPVPGPSEPKTLLLHGDRRPDPTPYRKDLSIRTIDGYSAERVVGASVAYADAEPVDDDSEPGGAHGSNWQEPLDERWHHFAMTVRPGAPFPDIFFDGRKKPGSAGPDDRLFDVHPTQLVVCGVPETLETVEDRHEGSVDMVRVSSGIRYDDDFTVPTALSPDEDTIVLLDFDDRSIVDRSPHRFEVRVGGDPELVAGRPR